MFVSFRKCSPPQKPDPISDRNCQNLYPFSDQNGSKTIPFRAAHTYIPYIGESPPRVVSPPRDKERYAPVLWEFLFPGTSQFSGKTCNTSEDGLSIRLQKKTKNSGTYEKHKRTGKTRQLAIQD